MGESFDPGGVAVFLAVASGVVSLSMTQPRQWGIRRLAFGVATSSAAVALLLLAYSPWWWTGLMWGPYQAYVGWAYMHRRSQIAAERFAYLHATTRLLSYIALADGDISDAKIEIIQSTYTRAGFSEPELREVGVVVRECVAQFREQGSDNERLLAWLDEACAAVATQSNHRTRAMLLRTALLITSSDGFVSGAEDKALRAAAVSLGLSASDVDTVWAEVQGDQEGVPRARRSTEDTEATPIGGQ